VLSACTVLQLAIEFGRLEVAAYRKRAGRAK
jgi:hypothetical protein